MMTGNFSQKFREIKDFHDFANFLGLWLLTIITYSKKNCTNKENKLEACTKDWKRKFVQGNVWNLSSGVMFYLTSKTLNGMTK